ncbi:pentatricopeptide repeat-containing protein At4g02750 isoform X2 [Phalaenopsis equestris]|uniref:pentatricopeptide repeat-containing protein At4g02750 isoform X2 n=1 Tax=Phalaenopsis equestris TaxID=78828 RepID=UPI0009E3DC86|nr:pentatricopeptide repeat-containing protein At4g02750 isoform X2 [Phalaenopsis equestris]
MRRGCRPPIPRTINHPAAAQPQFKRRNLSLPTSNNAKRKKKQSSRSLDTDIVRWNKNITYHMRHGRCDAARQLFDQMPRRTIVSWNTMLSGYLCNGKYSSALRLFDAMPHRDAISWNTMINGHVRYGELGAARRMFDKMPVRDTVSWNTMISAYAQSGHVEQAQEIFDRVPVKDSVSWNGILAAYLQNGHFDAAQRLFESNPHWDLVSWNSMIAGYVSRKRLVEARQLFDRLLEKDIVSWNTVISGYAQNGYMIEARRLFDESPCKDVFTWTAMVSGYAQNGMLDEARTMFNEMPERNIVSWNAIVAAYVQNKKMDVAEELFNAMPCKNISSWNTMVTGYAQAGMIEEARRIFDNMNDRDPISWSAMIAGYAQSGQSEEALHLFIEMGRSGDRINRSSFTCAFSTCADIAVLECGMQVHGRLVKAGYGLGCFVGNALLSMYFKCGSILEAYKAFQGISQKDVVTWNTMIVGYARHGFGVKALEVFDLMRTTEIKPDNVTLQDFGIKPKPEHYTCMIDLLGRAGRLTEAQSLIKDLPFEPDATMWGALLGASRIHHHTELGRKAAQKIFEMEPDNAGMYVLLSNLYASSGSWDEVSKLRVVMQDRGVRKVPGFSWLEVDNKVHTFSVGDTLHPDKEKIYAFLGELEMKMKKAGYVSATNLVLHDVEEEEKEQMLRFHSEKLAVAYGILRMKPGRPVRVIKNLRVCEDCHNAIKYIALIESRLIILRDSNRFHHFSGGSCSCRDYW